MTPDRRQLVLGTANLADFGDRRHAFDLLDAFADLGGAIIDTAAVYGDWIAGETGRSESIIGEWMATRKTAARPFVATKGGHPPLANMQQSRLDTASVVADAEASLVRLRVEAIDLYYLHRDDPSRPVEDVLAGPALLVRQGKVRHVGLSNWTATRVAEARAAAVVEVSSTQVLGNVLSNLGDPPVDPTIVRLDRSLLRDAGANDTSLWLFSSQCNGVLSKAVVGSGSPYGSPDAREAIVRIRELARQHGVDPTNLALCFLLDLSPQIFPVIGPKNVAQLQESMRATELEVPRDVLVAMGAEGRFDGWT